MKDFDAAARSRLAAGRLLAVEPRTVKSLFRLAAVVLGLLQVWNGLGRNLASGDATAYLDTADAFGRGDLSAALNPFWSPLYPLLLAAPLLVADAPRRELLVVSLSNFALYLFALACFERFLREFVSFQHLRGAKTGEDAGERRGDEDENAWLVAGYATFLWSALALNYVPRVSPDVLVSALVYAASALLLRARLRRGGRATFVLLGLTLGLGYLAKAVMFPLAFVFLLGAGLAAGNLRRAAPRVGLSLLAFLCVAAPLVCALSSAKHRPTFGESGRLNYAWHVTAEPRFIHWQGGPTDAPAHPTRRISDSPAAYEFGSPFETSYPPWFDPSYWNEGLRPRFDPRKQLAAVARNVRSLLGLYSPRSFPNGLLVALLVLLSARGLRRARASLRGAARRLASHLFLLLPALAALAGYLLIHVEPRYLAAFVVVLFLCLLACAHPVETETGRTAEKQRAGFALAAVILTAALFVSVVPSTLRAAYVTTRRAAARGGLPPNTHADVAEALRGAGVGGGERVASVGETMFASWPRLARVRVVAEVPHRVSGVSRPPTGEVGKFWAADEAGRARVLGAFARAGARAVVADRVPGGVSTDGWRRIGATSFHVFSLAPESQGRARQD